MNRYLLLAVVWKQLLFEPVSELPPTVGYNMIKLLLAPVSEPPPTVGCRLETAVI